MPNVASIQPTELKKFINDGNELALVDVREQGVFGQSHLLYAVCIPLSHLELRVRYLLPRFGVRLVVMDGGGRSRRGPQSSSRSLRSSPRCRRSAFSVDHRMLFITFWAVM